MLTVEGDHDARDLRFAIVASRFNDEFVAGLLSGALECLKRHGAGENAIAIYRVPGAFEIPQAAHAIASAFDAVVALGCILRGETPHFEFIANQVTTELSRIACETGVPIAFGVITCETLQQAIDRSSPGAGNKGWEAALAAIEMARLWRAVRTVRK
ncbi:MAG TPA: 6,7-dimethyl-8-ribityllumazine synthase [Thermoanaerobaculia bacterium]|nr:6,7-dimethyl-8-ribityllumazine synthase [Thermoanaerobaculia bacterium]